MWLLISLKMISNLSRWLYNRRVRKRLAAAHKRLLNYRIGANAAAKVEEEIPDVYGYNDPVPPRLFLRLKTAGTIEFELLRAIGYFIATLLICSFFYFFFVMR